MSNKKLINKVRSSMKYADMQIEQERLEMIVSDLARNGKYTRKVEQMLYALDVLLDAMIATPPNEIEIVEYDKTIVAFEDLAIMQLIAVDHIAEQEITVPVAKPKIKKVRKKRRKNEPDVVGQDFFKPSVGMKIKPLDGEEKQIVEIMTPKGMWIKCTDETCWMYSTTYEAWKLKGTKKLATVVSG